RGTSTTGTARSAAAPRAPSTMAPGALSPPMASMAIGSISVRGPGTGRSGWRAPVRSGDLDGHPAAVPAAVAAHDVGHLGGVAARAHAAGGAVEAPGAGLAA